MRSDRLGKGTTAAAAAALLGAALLPLAACGTDDELVTGKPLAGAAGVEEGVNATGKGAGTGDDTGMPCDVQQLFENRCVGCHLGNTSVPALLTYDDLMKPSRTVGQNLAQASLARMKDPLKPMPPAPSEPPAADEIAVVEAWIKAGMPKGTSCTPAAGTPVGGPNPYATPSVCTSNARWTRGNEESPSMHPGGACITCHLRKGPAYTVAGTVYPTAHEPLDCNGSPGGVTVVVKDKNGVETSIPVNAVGNFYLKKAIAPPFTVKVVGNGKERVMATPLTAGDCNSCHTEAGLNGAPGRVMAP